MDKSTSNHDNHLDRFLAIPVFHKWQSQSFEGSRHITLEFTLLDENRLPRNPTGNEFEVLHRLLPSHTGVGVVGTFLVVYVQQLPKRPWPVSVAGLPLFITTNKFEIPWKIGRPGNVRLHVLDHLDAQEVSSRPIYKAVISYFEGKMIGISEIVWIAGYWRITVNTVETQHLPGKICKTTAFYLSAIDKPATPTDAAFRGKGPVDNTAYSPLRPGILVAANGLLTTSGVLVQSNQNEIFMTASSHGFPPGDTNVYHPNVDGSLIGQVTRRLADTDITLVRLREGMAFENHTFQSSDEPAGVTFQGIKDPFDMRRYDILSMDNPFTGSTDGQFVAVSMLRLPSDDQDEHTYVEQVWGWYSQDMDNMPVAGRCESAIWDTDGYVVGFFRYFSDADHVGIGIAAQELVHNEYNLCHT